MSHAAERRPLVVHVVHRFDTGGLENGIVNLINHMPPQHYRHAVLALTEVTDFRHRITQPDVMFASLHKPPGQGVWQYPKLFKLFRQWRPDVVHTRNLGTLECQLPAWAAGVPARVHGEHGRDVGDLHGHRRRNHWTHRLYRPFVQHYVALSRDLAAYLQMHVSVPDSDVTQIYNGVDMTRFVRHDLAIPQLVGCPWDLQDKWVIGTVGRMHPVKHQVLLAQAFVQVVQALPALRPRLRSATARCARRPSRSSMLQASRTSPGCPVSAAMWRMSCGC
jgi:sugar transferase (PEP-CTERM/EpsH1 system associated)